MAQEEEKFGYLRERVAALEAVIGIHQEMLKEVRDAVSGINTSLRILTTIEERMVAVQEASSDSRTRLTAVEQELAQLKSETGMNTHHRTLREKLGLSLAGVLVGAAGAYAFKLIFGA